MEQGYDIILGNSSAGPRSEKGAVQRMVNRKVDGIICAPDPWHFELYQSLLDTGLPIVEIMTHVSGGSAPSVLVDDVAGGALAGRHLLDLGHRRIGFLSYVEDFYAEIRLRREGIRGRLRRGLRRS
jgi:DNA-binding LacI/PurR family transcriptional regulator